MNGLLRQMRQPTVTYKQFDVVVVPFPFTDRSTTKKRPALVLSDEAAFNAGLGRSVMAMITTAGHAPWLLDVKISDLDSAGLPSPSVARMKLFTLDNSLVIKQIGSLGNRDQGSVKKALRQLFNL